MTGEIFELMIEFTVILISPIIYHLYLLKYKKLPKEVVFKDIKIYMILYAMLAFAGLLLFFK